MALDKQINLFGIDTNAFLSNKEKQIKSSDMQINVLINDKKLIESENIKLRAKIKKYNSLLNKNEYNEYSCDTANSISSSLCFLNNELKLNLEILRFVDKEYRWRKKIEKSKLLLEFLRVVTLNKTKMLYNNQDTIKLRTLDTRYLRYIDKNDEEQLNLKKVIGMFESSLSRSFNVPLSSKDGILNPSEDIFVVDIYYYDLAQDLILNGFMHNGFKYIYFSSSAGQIRTKKAVFVKEQLFIENEKRLTCGLSLNQINECGGMNINKYLAYLSLCNSATDLWGNLIGKPFDIDRCIVVDDFETQVKCKVDDINYQTYEITENVEQDMPIPHTDGCGMILPSCCQKNFMVRLPWIKGLLGSFDFKRFIEVNNCSPTVYDIWGKSYDIIKDDIQIIFTKSQLKMYKYYSSWDEYKDNFKKYKCEACICNMEENKISNAKINYQMLQTLHDMTDDEVKSICKYSKDKILKLSDSLSNMVQFYGIYDFEDTELYEDEDDFNGDDEFIQVKKQESYFQKALKIYPELINDPASKDDIRALKDSLVKQYKSGKLEVMGKFTFVLPDLYAFCQWLFVSNDTGKNQKVPAGLLDNKEVYCRLYKTSKELDCLRSPHLYIEHAIRNNVCSKKIDGIPISEWFTTDAIYTSTYDLISRILQFDVDGDRLLVLAQKNIIAVAKRCMDGVNPLYYEMKKAKSEIVTKQSMYNGLIKAFTGGNIGGISNDITKIWNSDEISEESLKSVRWLCMETNFTIDFAKTLFKPTRPDDVDKILKKYGKQKVPFFFQYAKNKEASKCEASNKSIMNRICAEIEDKKISFKAIKKLERPSLNILLSVPADQIILNDDVYSIYNEMSKSYGNKISGDKYNSNVAAVVSDVKNKLSVFGYSDEELSNMLCYYLYNKPSVRKKNLLWRLYGDIILSNIKRNIDRTTTCCKKCGKRVNKKDIVDGKCKTCNNTYEKIGTKVIQCIDCGCDVVVDAKDNKTCRCTLCKKEHTKKLAAERKRKQRLNVSRDQF